jgi:hypothetical protein
MKQSSVAMLLLAHLQSFAGGAPSKFRISKGSTPNKYKPHQNYRECLRRQVQTLCLEGFEGNWSNLSPYRASHKEQLR